MPWNDFTELELNYKDILFDEFLTGLIDYVTFTYYIESLHRAQKSTVNVTENCYHNICVY